MKPDTVTAMQNLITQIKQTLPFDSIDSDFCSDICAGCSVKLIDYLADEMNHWEMRISQGETPTLGDVNKLAKAAKKIRTVLCKNNLIS